MADPPLSPALRPFDVVGDRTISIVDSLGRFGTFFFEALIAIFTPPFKLRAFIDRINYIGFRSLLIILLTGAFTGMVLGLQVYLTLVRFGSEAFLGPAVALSLIRELGPVLTALMVTGRAGSAITAEIGIMRITEQIDALETMALDPFKYLVTPKFIAAMISLPLLCAIFDVVGIYGGWLVGVKLLGVNPGSYFYEMEQTVVWRDVYSGIAKSFSFGVIIAWIGCYKGYNAGHGAEGVSKATTESVVLTSVLILVWDYFLTSVML